MSEITNSGIHYWGEGFDESERIADKQAFEDFTKKLGLEMSDKFQKVSEDKSSVKEYAKSAIGTYLNTSFKLYLSRKEEAHSTSIRVVRHIEKENLETLFHDRKMIILQFFEEGLKAHKENRIQDALQKYYWSFLLLKTHPENQSIRKNSSDIALIKLLPSKIEQIFNSLEFKVEKIKLDNNDVSGRIVLSVLSGGNPVEDLSFNYKVKNDWNFMTCKSGRGTINFSHKDDLKSGSIPLRVEYHFEETAGIDKNVSDIFENFYQIPYFKSANYELKIDESDLVSETVEESLIASNTNFNISAIKDKDQIAPIKESIAKIIEGIETENFSDLRNEFTEQGWSDLNSLVKYGNARLLDTELNLKIVQVNNEYVVRKVPMSFRFDSQNKEFIEDVVFYVDSAQQKVSGLSFSISQIAINDILNHSDAWGSEKDKWQIISFMENYKTAYCLRRIDYIEKVFDEDALIIVGRKLTNAPKLADDHQINYYGDNAEYIQKSKTDYLKSLRSVFRSNEFINIHFEDNLVKRRNAKEKVFGIQIAQHYTSTRYKDKGYLFLMLDLQDSINPKIYVRTWQPKKNSDGSLFGLNDFHF